MLGSCCWCCSVMCCSWLVCGWFVLGVWWFVVWVYIWCGWFLGRCVCLILCLIYCWVLVWVFVDSEFGDKNLGVFWCWIYYWWLVELRWFGVGLFEFKKVWVGSEGNWGILEFVGFFVVWNFWEYWFEECYIIDMDCWCIDVFVYCVYFGVVVFV